MYGKDLVSGLEFIMWLAALGVLCGIVGSVYALYWLCTHVTITMG
jgi:hypothetical protein